MTKHRVCPWWIGYLLACPLRRYAQNPKEILLPYVRPGMMVLEPGPGMGFFTLDMAEMVGPSGVVITVDVQPKMLARLRSRAAKRGLLGRIETRLAKEGTMGLEDLAGKIDFVLAFAVVHEMPSPETFFREAAVSMKPGAALLYAEPTGHVKTADFENNLATAAKAALRVTGRPSIRRSHAALLQKN